MSPRETGLSLMELVVAMAIFALVAVMGLQALTGMMRLRDRLTETAQATDRLGTGLSLLRADLSAALPIVFHPPGRARARSALEFLAGPGARLSISRGGLPDPAGPGGGLRPGRVDWRLDPGTGDLARREWPVTDPARPDAAGPEQVVLTGVAGLDLRSYRGGLGWVEGSVAGTGPSAAPAGLDSDSAPVPDSYSDTLPEAVELILTLRDGRRIRLVETLK